MTHRDGQDLSRARTKEKKPQTRTYKKILSSIHAYGKKPSEKSLILDSSSYFVSFFVDEDYRRNSNRPSKLYSKRLPVNSSP